MTDSTKPLCVACDAAPCRWGYQRCWDCDSDWRGAYQGYFSDEEYRRRVANRRAEGIRARVKAGELTVAQASASWKLRESLAEAHAEAESWRRGES